VPRKREREEEEEEEEREEKKREESRMSRTCEGMSCGRNLIPAIFVIVCYVASIVVNAVASIVFATDDPADNPTTAGFAYSYLQPNNATFAIWAVIYTYQAIFLVVQLVMPSIRDDIRVKRARPALCAYYLLNGAWLLTNAAANDGRWWSSYWTTVIVLWSLTAYLGFGVYYYVSTQNPELIRSPNEYYKKFDTWDDDNDWSERFYVWKSKKHMMFRLLAQYPISVNLAWVVLASILNLSNTVFKFPELGTNPVQVGSPDWATGIAVLATIIGLHFSYTRQDVVYNLALIWALNGIKNNQSSQDTTSMPAGQPVDSDLAQAATLCMVLAALGILVGWMRSFAQYLTWKYANQTPSHKGSDSLGSTDAKAELAKSLTGV